MLHGKLISIHSFSLPLLYHIVSTIQINQIGWSYFKGYIVFQSKRRATYFEMLLHLNHFLFIVKTTVTYVFLNRGKTHFHATLHYNLHCCLWIDLYTGLGTCLSVLTTMFHSVRQFGNEMCHLLLRLF